MSIVNDSKSQIYLASWVSINEEPAMISNVSSSIHHPPTAQQGKFDVFRPLRQWLDNVQVNNPQLAHKICRSVPNQCPFERHVKLGGYTVLYIPPLCKLNPLYEELVALRFRALCYLADECGEDVTMYC